MMATIRIPKSKRSEYVTMTSPPLRCSGGGKKFRPPPERGASRLPNTGSASAYPCAGDIIARFVEFGKVWGKAPKGGILQSPPTAMPAPFNKGAYWCRKTAPLVKGGTPPKAEGGFRPPCLPLWGRCPRRGRRGFPRQKRNPPAGGLGIDFFPYHVILKIKRGAAGRREPPFAKRSNR